jgi:hypothetical protein
MTALPILPHIVPLPAAGARHPVPQRKRRHTPPTCSSHRRRYPHHPGIYIQNLMERLFTWPGIRTLRSIPKA